MCGLWDTLLFLVDPTFPTLVCLFCIFFCLTATLDSQILWV